MAALSKIISRDGTVNNDCDTLFIYPKFELYRIFTSHSSNYILVALVVVVGVTTIRKILVRTDIFTDTSYTCSILRQFPKDSLLLCLCKYEEKVGSIGGRKRAKLAYFLIKTVYFI